MNTLFLDFTCQNLYFHTLCVPSHDHSIHLQRLLICCLCSVSLSKGCCLVLQAMFVESLGGDLGGKLMGVVPVWAIYVTDLMFALYIVIHTTGCLWLFTGLTESAQGGHCWLESVGEAHLLFLEESKMQCPIIRDQAKHSGGSRPADCLICREGVMPC